MAQESILVAQESILEDSEVDSGLNSGVGFKNVDFPLVFQGFWAATAGSTAPAQKSGTARRTPQGRIQESFFPLEEPYSETLLGKNLPPAPTSWGQIKNRIWQISRLLFF